jgi:hypothetical protein
MQDRHRPFTWSPSSIRRNTRTPLVTALPPRGKNEQSHEPPSWIGATGAVKSARTWAGLIARYAQRLSLLCGDVFAAYF